MKKIILLLLVISFTACNTSHPDYESNKNSQGISNKQNQLDFLWEMKGWGLTPRQEGWGNKYLHASWIHLHWPSSPSIISNFLSKIGTSI